MAAAYFCRSTLIAGLVLASSLASAMPAAQKTPTNNVGSSQNQNNKVPWSTLKPAELQALAPLHATWDTLSGRQQQVYQRMTAHYASMSPEQQRRFQARLTQWAQLPQAKRAEIRRHYKAYRKLKPNQRASRPQTPSSAGLAAPGVSDSPAGAAQ